MPGVEKEIVKIEKTIAKLNDQILEKRPAHFGVRDVVNAFFGALIIGLPFIFKGGLIRITENIDLARLYLIVLFTILVLTAEIYFVGYSRVVDKKKRPFGQFWLKRIVTLLAITFLVSTLLVFLFGVESFVTGSYQVFKLIVAISMPCAIGAAIPSLLKKF